MKHRHLFTRNRIAARRAAFSLLELAIVITVTSTVAVLGLEVAGKFIARRAYTTTEKQVHYLDDALVKFKKVYGRLPCPTLLANVATASDGLEGDCTSGTATRKGLVPYRVLNLPRSATIDGYGSRINYVVSRQLAIDSVTYNSSAATIEVRTGKLEQPCGTANCSVSADPAASAGAAYFLFSSGKNKRGALNIVGQNEVSCGIGCYDCSILDLRIDGQNCGIGRYLAPQALHGSVSGISTSVYYDSTFNNGTQLANYFDDIVAWRGKDRL